MESGEYAWPLWGHDLTWTWKLTCMHTICLRVWAYISTKLGQIREIKVFMDSGEYARPLWAQHLTTACKLACMNAMCLHAQAHISAKLDWIREIKVSMESGEYAGSLWAHNLTEACKLMHAHYVLAHTGLYNGQILSDQRYHGIYGIRRSCPNSLST